MNQENEKTPVYRDVVNNGLVDGDITKAISLIEESSRSQYRQHALDNTSEDKRIYQGLTDSLANPDVFEQLKDTVLMQIVRLVSEDNQSLPKAFPVSATPIDEAKLYAVDAIKEKFAVEGHLEDEMRDVIEHSCFMEGTSFLRILPDSYKDLRKNKSLERLSFKRVDEAKVFYDIMCKSDVSEGRWVAFMETYHNEEANEIAKSLYGFSGYIKPGDPLSVFEPLEGTGNDEDVSAYENDETTFYTYYNKATKQYIVFAGGDAQLIKKLEDGKYPCKNAYGHADIPVAQYNATPYRKGIHSVSYIGAAKDLARQRVRQFNTILPHFERVNNPILAVMGAISPQEIADNIAEVIEAQAQGLNGILPLADPQSRVETLFPQDISNAFEKIISIFDNELAKRLGLNLSLQEKQVAGGVQTATQTIEQAKMHAKAIANLNKLNRKFYKRVYDITFNYGRVLLKGTDTKFTINIGDIPVDLTGNDIVDLVKDWRGDWKIDTSVELELTRNEKLKIMEEKSAKLMNMLQLQALSEAEIKPIKDIEWASYVSLGLDDIIQRKEFDAFFTAIVQRNSQQPIEAQQGGSSKPVTGSEKGLTPEIQRQAARLGGAAIDQPGEAGIQSI